MTAGATCLSCPRQVSFAAEQAFYTDRRWRGKRMMSFRRWFGIDNGLHTVIVLADGIRVMLDEAETPRAVPHHGSERDGPSRLY
jgi:hypothetical protein